jgi:DNA-binding transcriptional MerR regulator
VTFALVRVRRGDLRLDLESFARYAGVHPDLVRRLVALGLLEPVRERGEWWFGADQLAELARIERLRRGCDLNYAAIGLVLDLLDRIAELEAELRTVRRSRPPTGGAPWTRTDSR